MRFGPPNNKALLQNGPGENAFLHWLGQLYILVQGREREREFSWIATKLHVLISHGPVTMVSRCIAVKNIHSYFPAKLWAAWSWKCKWLFFIALFFKVTGCQKYFWILRSLNKVGLLSAESNIFLSCCCYVVTVFSSLCVVYLQKACVSVGCP